MRAPLLLRDKLINISSHCAAERCESARREYGRATRMGTRARVAERSALAQESERGVGEQRPEALDMRKRAGRIARSGAREKVNVEWCRSPRAQRALRRAALHRRGAEIAQHVARHLMVFKC